MKVKPNFLTIFTFILLSLYFIRVLPLPASSDTYWHLSIGRQTWQEKKIPNQDKFIYGVADTHFTSTEWLFGILSYHLVAFFGFSGLLILRVILGLITLYFLYLTLKLIYQDKLALNIAIALIGFVLALRLNDRPEMTSFAILSLINYLCIFYLYKRKLHKLTYALPIIFLIWPSLHPYTIFGIAIFSLHMTLLIFEHFISAQKRQDITKYTLIFISSIILTAFQYKKILYFLEIRRLQEFRVSEVLSLYARLTEIEFDFLKQVPAEIYIYLALLGLYILLLIVSPTKKSAAAPFAFFYFPIFLMPLVIYRLIALSLVIAAPALWSLAASSRFAKRGSFRKLALKTFYVSLVILITASIYTKNIIGSKMYQIVTFDNNGKPIAVKNRTWAPRFPHGSLEIIRSLNTQRLFTAPLWNNYFIWHLPQVKVMSDVMIEHLTQESFTDEAEIALGGPNWQNLLSKYRIDTVINSQPDSGQIINTPVYNLANWQLIFIDSISAVWARDDVIRSQPLDLSALEPQLPTLLKFKPENETAAIEQLHKLLEFDPKNGFARGQLLIYYIDAKKDLDAAKILAEESRSLLPEEPQYSFFLTVIYAAQNKCSSAKDFAKEAIRKSYNDYNIRQSSKKALETCTKY